MLVGREGECAHVDRLLAEARAGASGALVVRGEPGIGKSALLAYAAGAAGGMTVVRALGVESEAELEFSGLLEVCRPLLDRLDELPARQADVLRAALGLAAAEQADRFTIGAATLGLLASAAEQSPLLVLVDDAHWLDRASADALLFAARRLEADRAALLFAVRDPDPGGFPAAGLEELVLTGLSQDAAARLLREVAPATAPPVAAALHAATGGNPLALVELPRLLTPAQLAGRLALDDPLPTAASVGEAFAKTLAGLSDETRRALLAVAVATSSGLDVVAATLAAAGADGAVLEPAEDAGLIQIEEGQVRFRHPLVRAAVQQAAVPSERRAAHRAAAAALEGSAYGERRAWHLAAAALGPDEAVAAQLEAAGRNALDRAGYAAAAAALERAAQLTPDDDARDRRLLEAAAAAWQAGSSERAQALLAGPLEREQDPAARARGMRLRAAIELLKGDAATAAATLLEAAALVEADRPAEAATSLVDACEAFLYHGDLEAALAAGRRARELVPTDGGAGDALVEIALGEALAIAGLIEDGAPRLERALDLVAASEELRRDARCLTRAAIALWWLERPAAGRELALVAIGVARERGAAGALPYALEVAAVHDRRLGLWSSAYAAALEATALARETAQPNMAAHCLTYMAAIDAARGHEEACRRGVGEAIELAERAGLRPLRLRLECVLGRLELGLGRLDAAIERLEPVRAAVLELGHCEPDIAPWSDLVEAYVRTGDLERAETVRAELEATRLGSAPLWPRAAAALCAGLLASDDEFDAHFETATALQEQIGDRFAAARARLCHGERLRRAGRRTDAREQLRPALATFDELGARPWADRAGFELRASGETLRRRVAFDDEQLTPQELQIAAHVAEGKTNREVGAALFLSHKTVETHLARVYRKLHIHSRGELIRLFASGEAVTDPAGERPIIER